MSAPHPAERTASGPPAADAVQDALRRGIEPGPLEPSNHPDIEAVLLSRAALAQRIAALGRAIAADYSARDADAPPVFALGVLKGALFFLTDLVRAIELPLTVDTLRAASYGARTTTSGTVRISQPPTVSASGRDVLVIDMVLDTGLTLRTLDAYLREQGARSVRCCVLASKNRDGPPPYPADYVGFAIPDRWVVGYGGDYDDRYRNLPYLGILRPEVYSRRT